MGAGPISEPKVIYSAEDMPQSSPQQVFAISYNSTAINVSWTPIDQSREMLRGKLIGHRVIIIYNKKILKYILCLNMYIYIFCKIITILNKKVYY